MKHYEVVVVFRDGSREAVLVEAESVGGALVEVVNGLGDKYKDRCTMAVVTKEQLGERLAELK